MGCKPCAEKRAKLRAAIAAKKPVEATKVAIDGVFYMMSHTVRHTFDKPNKRK